MKDKNQVYETENKRSVSVLRMNHMKNKLGISRSCIYEKLDPKSPRYDPTFPKPIKIGLSAIGWLEDKVDAWIVAKEH
ncbi:AlpA family phage regulatory protein [Halomonas sp. 5021]|uniref:helix-turn-helix transcriptional regulator n=1 Tax=Halomonas sp. 5021 TaxID=3082156 RepID=UPI002FCC8D0E